MKKLQSDSCWEYQGSLIDHSDYYLLMILIIAKCNVCFLVSQFVAVVFLDFYVCVFMTQSTLLLKCAIQIQLIDFNLEHKYLSWVFLANFLPS